MTTMMIIDQVGCARCDGKGHDQIQFLKLTHPVIREDQVIYTYWATCPTNGEPILMEVLDVEDAKA